MSTTDSPVDRLLEEQVAAEREASKAGLDLPCSPALRRDLLERASAEEVVDIAKLLEEYVVAVRRAVIAVTEARSVRNEKDDAASQARDMLLRLQMKLDRVAAHPPQNPLALSDAQRRKLPAAYDYGEELFAFGNRVGELRERLWTSEEELTSLRTSATAAATVQNECLATAHAGIMEIRERITAIAKQLQGKKRPSETPAPIAQEMKAATVKRAAVPQEKDRRGPKSKGVFQTIGIPNGLTRALQERDVPPTFVPQRASQVRRNLGSSVGMVMPSLPIFTFVARAEQPMLSPHPSAGPLTREALQAFLDNAPESLRQYADVGPQSPLYVQLEANDYWCTRREITTDELRADLTLQQHLLYSCTLTKNLPSSSIETTGAYAVTAAHALLRLLELRASGTSAPAVHVDIGSSLSEEEMARYVKALDTIGSCHVLPPDGIATTKPQKESLSERLWATHLRCIKTLEKAEPRVLAAFEEWRDVLGNAPAGDTALDKQHWQHHLERRSFAPQFLERYCSRQDGADLAAIEYALERMNQDLHFHELTESQKTGYGKIYGIRYGSGELLAYMNRAYGGI